MTGRLALINRKAAALVPEEPKLVMASKATPRADRRKGRPPTKHLHMVICETTSDSKLLYKRSVVSVGRGDF